MGFTVYYRSTEPLAAATRDRINAATDRLCEGRTWLSCEPVWFFRSADADGFLEGGSKPNFSPHPDDIAEAEQEGLPDGTIQDALDVLCELSRQFGVDWEFSHDHDPGPIGFIRGGNADSDLCHEIESIGLIGGMFARQIDASERPNLHAFRHDIAEDRDDDDDDQPQILRFPRS